MKRKFAQLVIGLLIGVLLTLSVAAAPNLATRHIFANVFVNGVSDAIQMRVQGHTTQTNNLLTLEQSDGTDVLTVTNTGALRAAGDVTVGGLMLPATTALTLTTAGQAVTPTTELLVLDTTGDISMTLATCSNDGQHLRLYGRDNNTVTVNDTNIRSTDGNAVTLGQYDIVGWSCQDTEWIHA